jgi:tRNA A-37 threonylcarbamoyl transferase component Bud32
VESFRSGHPLIASGRDANVYALDEHTVLRRYLRRDVPAYEVDVMRHARASGFPVPDVKRVSGPDMVLERIGGPTMQQVLETDHTQIDRNIRLLAALHERLHEISAPPGLPAVGGGDTLLHLDLHPNNVLLSPNGPYVIDWANARRGHWADDVAQTVVILWSALADPALRDREALVHHVVETFLASFDREVVRSHLPAAVARRLADANVTDAERQVTQRGWI